MKRNKERIFFESVEQIKQYQKEKLDLVYNDNPIISIVNLDEFELTNNFPLSQMTFAIKDNYQLKHSITTGGSKILENYESNYNAHVIDKLLENGAIPLYKSNLDELAMGGSGLYAFNGPVKNFMFPKRIVGGSSSGSAYLVAKKIVDFALGSDTGDSVTFPAGLMGIYGFKPTWGAVSRHGLNDFSPSLDTVGWFATELEIIAKVADIVIEKDEKDSTSINFTGNKNFLKNIKTDKKFKIVYSPQLIELIKEPKIKIKYLAIIKNLEDAGHKLEAVSFESNLLKTIPFVYKIISSVESLSSNFNLTGWLFGEEKNKHNNNYFEKISANRKIGFKQEVKTRFSLGAYANQNKEYLEKAKKLRFLIIKEIENKMKDFDLMIIPTTTTFAPLVEESAKKVFNNDTYSLNNNFLSFINLCGRPALSVPFNRKNEFPIGITIVGNIFEDLKVLQLARIMKEVDDEL